MNESKMIKLKNEGANRIDDMLTYKEISDILYNMKYGESPGLSGFFCCILQGLLETVRDFCS